MNSKYAEVEPLCWFNNFFNYYVEIIHMTTKKHSKAFRYIFEAMFVKIKIISRILLDFGLNTKFGTIISK